MTAFRGVAGWAATALLLVVLLCGCEPSNSSSEGGSTGPTSGPASTTPNGGGRSTGGGSPTKGPGGSPILGVDLTEGADRATRLVDVEKAVARLCPTPRCVRVDVTVDPGPDEDVSDSCEILENGISHPKPLRVGDRIKVVINRPCDQEEPDPSSTITTSPPP